MDTQSLSFVITVLSTFASIYTGLLIIKALLSWFPNINWYDQPFAALNQVTEPYLNIFRSIIPPLGGIDISFIVAFFAFDIISKLLISSLASLGRYTVGF
ncbi:MAG: YggT family protein [Cyanobacteria bacterium P01_A01_bin.84]